MGRRGGRRGQVAKKFRVGSKSEVSGIFDLDSHIDAVYAGDWYQGYDGSMYRYAATFPSSTTPLTDQNDTTGTQVTMTTSQLTDDTANGNADRLYQAEVFYFPNNVTLSSNYSPGTASSKDDHFMVFHFGGNLTINSGVTFRPSQRNLGLIIYVAGDFTNNGTINMGARGANHSGTGDSGGAVTAAGYMMYKNSSGNEYRIYGGGAANAGSSTTYSTGGGGRGGNQCGSPYASGAAGQIFSGGAGGGGARCCSAQAGGANGGKGGNGCRSCGANCGGGGGAGNPGGSGSGQGGTYSAGSTGIGGSIQIYCDGTFAGSGSVVSNGSTGGNSYGSFGGYGAEWAPGAGSGGGSINIFAGTNSFGGTTTANGGSRGGTNGSVNGAQGGGAGDITTFAIS